MERSGSDGWAPIRIRMRPAGRFILRGLSEGINLESRFLLIHRLVSAVASLSPLRKEEALRWRSVIFCRGRCGMFLWSYPMMAAKALRIRYLLVVVIGRWRCAGIMALLSYLLKTSFGCRGLPSGIIPASIWQNWMIRGRSFRSIY